MAEMRWVTLCYGESNSMYVFETSSVSVLMCCFVVFAYKPTYVTVCMKVCLYCMFVM